MNIEYEVGMWFELNKDNEGNIIIEMPYDNNGNGLRLLFWYWHFKELERKLKGDKE